jgi:predicted transcriptional regulator
MINMPTKTFVDIENKIIELSNREYSKNQVAKMLGVTFKVVDRVAKENNLEFAIPDNTKVNETTEKFILKLSMK